MSGYATPDSFGSTPTTSPRLTDVRTGITWTLGFGVIDVNGVPAVVWFAVSTWQVAKGRLGPTWSDAKRKASTWGIAKAEVGA
jgi:hypothetical protein